MRTVVLQSFRVDNVPPWIERCLRSVREWSELRGFDYSFADDSSFALCGAEYLARVGKNMRAIVNLSRLELAKDAHERGYDRAIWLDADVLVFHPELFSIDVVERYAFARETWVSKRDGNWTHSSNVNNCAFVCMKGEPDLDTLIRLTRDVGVHRKIEKSLQTGTYLLTGLQQSLAFELLDNVGLFSNHVVKAIANGDEGAMGMQAIAHETPVFAANLCASDRDPPPVSEAEAETVVDRLLESRGDIVNRWLLKSSANLVGVKPKPGMVALFPHADLVKLQFRQIHDYEPDLANPQTYNERIAARKLTLTDPIYRDTTDKYAARRFVAERVGEHVLVPLLQVCDRAEDVDLDTLPTPFIVKPTHGSGWKEFVHDRETLDRESLRAKMRKWLRTNFFDSYFEIHYRDIPRRIVVEKLLRTSDGQPPEDFRLNVIRGVVRTISNSINRGTPEAQRRLYDRSWRRLAVTTGRPPAPDRAPPACLGEMMEVAEALARDFEFARIDLYNLDNKVYFSEITHTPTGGLTRFRPRDFDLALGRIMETGEPFPERYYVTASPVLVQPKRPAAARAAPEPTARPKWRGFDSRLLQFNSLSNFKVNVPTAISKVLPQTAQANAGASKRPVQLSIELGAGVRRQADTTISCLMVSGGDPDRARYSIASYRKQSWTRRELVIVDVDGDGRMARLVDQIGDPSIRLVRADAAGDARAKGIAEAQGSYVCNWEESALHHPARLEAQLAVLKVAKARANVLDPALGWMPAERRLSVVGSPAQELTLLAEKALLLDPAAYEWLRGAPVMHSLVRAAVVSYADLPELCMLVRSAKPLWVRDRDDVQIPGYDSLLRQISLCFPVADFQRSLSGANRATVAADAG